MKIVDVDTVLARAESKLVSRPDGLPALDPAAREPGCESIRIVVASGPFVGITAVGNRCASEFTASNDQCAVEQTARF